MRVSAFWDRVATMTGPGRSTQRSPIGCIRLSIRSGPLPTPCHVPIAQQTLEQQQRKNADRSPFADSNAWRDYDLEQYKANAEMLHDTFEQSYLSGGQGDGHAGPRARTAAASGRAAPGRGRPAVAREGPQRDESRHRASFEAAGPFSSAVASAARGLAFTWPNRSSIDPTRTGAVGSPIPFGERAQRASGSCSSAGERGQQQGSRLGQARPDRAPPARGRSDLQVRAL